MTDIISARMAAKLEGDFVVFLIGMRVNRPWKFWKWGPVAAAMPRMLIELAKSPELGLLHARTFFGFPNIFVVQYWRSFEALHAYATDRTLAHLPAWKAFNRAIASNGDVGIWHETYLVTCQSGDWLWLATPCPLQVVVDPQRDGLGARTATMIPSRTSPIPEHDFC